MKNDLLKRGGGWHVCPVLTPLLPTKCLLIWGTLLNFIPPLQFLSVQGPMGTGAGVRAGPQSEAKWPAEPHRGRLLPAGCISGQHRAHATSHDQPVPFCDPFHRQSPHQTG